MIPITLETRCHGDTMGTCQEHTVLLCASAYRPSCDHGAGVKMKGPADDFEDFDEMGSPQSSLQMPSSSSLESQQRDEAEGASAEAMAEDERDAENAVNLKEEAQVFLFPLHLLSKAHHTWEDEDFEAMHP